MLGSLLVILEWWRLFLGGGGVMPLKLLSAVDPVLVVEGRVLQQFPFAF